MSSLTHYLNYIAHIYETQYYGHVIITLNRLIVSTLSNWLQFEHTYICTCIGANVKVHIMYSGFVILKTNVFSIRLIASVSSGPVIVDRSIFQPHPVLVLSRSDNTMMMMIDMYFFNGYSVGRLRLNSPLAAVHSQTNVVLLVFGSILRSPQ